MKLTNKTLSCTFVVHDCTVVYKVILQICCIFFLSSDNSQPFSYLEHESCFCSFFFRNRLSSIRRNTWITVIMFRLLFNLNSNSISTTGFVPDRQTQFDWIKMNRLNKNRWENTMKCHSNYVRLSSKNHEIYYCWRYDRFDFTGMVYHLKIFM